MSSPWPHADCLLGISCHEGVLKFVGKYVNVVSTSVLGYRLPRLQLSPQVSQVFFVEDEMTLQHRPHADCLLDHSCHEGTLKL